MLINQNPDDIDIVVTETQMLNNQQEAEDHEMVLLNQDKLNGHKMLNTKSSTTRIKRKEPIPLTPNQPKMDIQKYVDIQQGRISYKKRFSPTITHQPTKGCLRVNWNLPVIKNGKTVNERLMREFLYKQCGYDTAYDKANEFIEELIKNMDI
jgi:hypothetical protein